jgi:hypothetical protein
MKPTRDVILDLWPLYESGEASADTRALVEQHLREDPELARLLREAGGTGVLRPGPQALPQDAEMETLVRARRLVDCRRGALLIGLTLFGASAYLRAYRLTILGLSAACLVAWVLLTIFGRRWFRLPPRA